MMKFQDFKSFSIRFKEQNMAVYTLLDLNKNCGIKCKGCYDGI